MCKKNIIPETQNYNNIKNMKHMIFLINTMLQGDPKTCCYCQIYFWKDVKLPKQNLMVHSVECLGQVAEY